jgi:3-oxoacyl-[acyl-carrier protein] reductase
MTSESWMPNLLQGKVAIVTGGARGIGAAICRRFAAEGASVSFCYHSRREKAEHTLQTIQAAGGTAVMMQADIRSEADVQQLFAETKRRFGKVDIVVNNAAMNLPTLVESFTEELYRKHYDVNVLGLLLMAKEAGKYLGRAGCILNISSISSKIPTPGYSMYGGTKAAIDNITANLALEMGPRGIRVNAINPGMTKTEQLDEVPGVTPELRAQVSMMTPLQRLGEPEDIAAAAVLLCGEDARWITGECIRVSGGLR